MEPAQALVHVAPPPPSLMVNRADEVFERVSPYEGTGFRNHCHRLFHFTSVLLAREGLQMSRDLAYMIAMVHDLGLVSEQDEGHNYLQRSRALFHREAADLDLGDVDPRVVDECLVYNHRMFPVPNVSREAECFRRAVWIEHTRGLKRYGIERDTVRRVFAQYPRDNFDRVLVDFTKRVLRREPLTIVNGIFF